MSTTLSTNSSTPRRADVVSLWAGIVFSLAFTALIWVLGGRLDNIELLPDAGPAWYYWKLPQPTFWTHLTAWGFYALHQVTIWALIYYAQTRVKKYKAGLHTVNVVALAANVVFIFLHLLQTHIWYDGLAQDVSIFSSQGSVILLLVAVLLMENQRRGMFFGKKAPISKDIVRLVKKYHGYVFAWAIVYTFWYHPMVSTPGHLIGFIYMFLLMLQGSLFFTRMHVNRWWTLTQEVAVLFHGTLVAVGQGTGIWPMFLFGFAGIFVITQMHGLGLKSWHKWLIFSAYAAGTVWVYSLRGWEYLNEIIRIPLIEYLCVLVLALLIGGGLWVARRIRSLAGRGASAQASA